MNISSEELEEFGPDFISLDEADVLLNQVEELGDLEEIYTNDKINKDDDSEPEDDDSDVVSDNDSNDESDDDESDDEDDEDSDLSIVNVFVYINNFPVQMICLENVTELWMNYLKI